MNIFRVVFLLLLISTVSCSQVDIPQCENCDFKCLAADDKDVINNSCLDNYNCSFKVFENSKVSFEEFEGFASGSKTVFQMITSTEGDERIADDEFTNYLIFEIPSDQESFKVSAKEFKNLKVAYKTVCFCAEVKFIEPSAGCMQGQKQPNGSWFVQADLTIPFSYGDVPVKVEANFSL